MAAGGWVRYNIWGEPKRVGLGSRYWLKQAEYAYDWHVAYPGLRWEQLMYYYLFKSVGYDG
jgi:hypothetical protein